MPFLKQLSLLCLKSVVGPDNAFIRDNIITYTVSVLIAHMASYIIFLSAGTRRVFPVEVFLSRDVAW